MKYRVRKGRLDEAYFEMTPLIDIVFLLVIFFMVVINFQQLNVHADLRLPQTEHAIPPKDERGTRVVLNYTKMGTWVVSGETKTPAQIGNLLKIEAQVATRLADGSPDVTVVIRADKMAPYERIAPILALCAQPDVAISRVAFMTLTSRVEE